MKIPFDIKFRPQLESGEYRIETAKGYPVTIYRWDFKDNDGTPIMGSYVFEDGMEYCAGWTSEGRCYSFDGPNDYDLVIITPEPEPEPELTEFEQKVCEILYSDKPEYSASDDDSWKRASAELLELAKKEALKELQENLAFNDIFRVPEWLREILVMTKENGKKEAMNDLPRWRKKEEGFGYYCDTAGCLVCDGYEISIQALREKLPGFKED